MCRSSRGAHTHTHTHTISAGQVLAFALEAVQQAQEKQAGKANEAHALVAASEAEMAKVGACA